MTPFRPLNLTAPRRFDRDGAIIVRNRDHSSRPDSIAKVFLFLGFLRRAGQCKEGNGMARDERDFRLHFCDFSYAAPAEHYLNSTLNS